MSRRLILLLITTLALCQPATAQNYYPGIYGEAGAGGIYTSVNGGPETGPAPAVISVARTNSFVYSIGSVTASTTNWLGVGGVQTIFVNPILRYYFDPSSSAYTPSTLLSNLYSATLPHPYAWFSTNDLGIWFIRATNRVVNAGVTNTYRLEVSKTREQPPTLVSPNESPLNYIVYERSDPQPYIGSANGDGLKFQWQKAANANGPWVNIAGETNPTATNDYLQLFNVGAADAGYYRKYIYNNSGSSVTSTWAQLTVKLGPPAWSFGVQLGITNRAGFPSLTGNGSSFSPSITINNATKSWGYWRKDGVPQVPFGLNNGVRTYFPYLFQTNNAPLNGGGWNLTAFSVNYLMPSDSGNWDAVAFDAWGRSMTSSIVRILITNAPGGPVSITSQPLDTTNILGGTAIFLANATGAPPVTLQWFREDGAPLAASTNYLHVNATNLYVAYLKNADATGYYMVASDLNGSTATSRVARLTIAQPPTFLLEPVDVTVTEGGSATFSTLGTCNVPFKYQWLYNGSINNLSATNTTFTITNLLAAQNQAISVSVQLVSQFHTIVSAPARISIVATGLVATYRGQPWLKVLDTDTRVPGYSSLFSVTNETVRGRWTAAARPRMTLKDRTLHLATPAGVYYYTNLAGSGYATAYALVRWRANTLDLLVYTNTVIPGTSDHFLTVFYPTDEEGGAMNFVGYGSTSRGVYEVRDGVVGNAIPSLTTPYADGPGFFDGSGQLVRRGSKLLFASNSTERKPGATGTQLGIFLWDGATFTTLLNENSDLPGAATGFAGVGVAGFAGDAFAYDGSNVVANIVSSGTNSGIYLFNRDGVSLVADKTAFRPGTTQRFNNFSGVAIREGRPRFVAFNFNGFAVATNAAITELGGATILSAPAAGQSVTLANGDVRRLGEDGSRAFILTASPAWIIDGRRVQTVYNMVAEGQDVAIDVQFTDGSSGIFLSLAPASLPLPGDPVSVSPVTISGGLATFTFPTHLGKVYRVERSTNLSTWVYLTIVAGDGSRATVSTAAAGAGANYFRVVELP